MKTQDKTGVETGFLNEKAICLIEKYNKPGPRYTSYPPATYFHDGYKDTDYIQSLKESNLHGPSHISFYSTFLSALSFVTFVVAIQVLCARALL
ncbi:MAG: hypothetical protein HC905_21515 [Bacteroidales bacterium]|nr:hypothetical protein [Bacteroidales bacterium]